MGEITQEYEGREFEAAANLVNYYNWITDSFCPYLHGDGTEIGAGVGTYSQYLRPFFSNLDLVEPSPAQQQSIASRYKDDPHVRVFSESIAAYHQRVGDKARDSICLVNVLEHIDDDVAALQDLSAMLKDNGHLCIFVPALPFLYSKLDRIFGHFRRYSHAELKQKVENTGLKIVHYKYMDLAGVPAWGFVNTLCGSTNLNPRMAKIYDRFFVPCTRALEQLIPTPLGKSLLIVGRKNG